MVKTKIIATIGPASESTTTLRKLMLAGMDMVRLNCSHATHPWTLPDSDAYSFWDFHLR